MPLPYSSSGVVVEGLPPLPTVGGCRAFLDMMLTGGLPWIKADVRLGSVLDFSRLDQPSPHPSLGSDHAGGGGAVLDAGPIWVVDGWAERFFS